MCGICGIIDIKNKGIVSKATLKNMMRMMKHRGPDDEGLFHEGGIGLGFVRLSIIDLSLSGHQPMESADGRHVLVLNGEIYNYIELRQDLAARGHAFRSRTDTEVLLAAFREWGSGCLDKLNGMWAFAVYDRQEKTLFCARDRFGIKPFYYYQDDERLIFASEIPPLLPLIPAKPEANESVVYDYLVFNRTDQGEETFFKGIKKLQHGHMMTIRLTEDRGQKTEARIRKWYDLKTNLKEPFKTPEEFRETFGSSVGLRLRSDVPVGVCLSGGLDSSSIVSILLRDFHKKDLNTFSAVYGKGKTGDESEFIDLFKDESMNMRFTTPSAGSLMENIGRFILAMGEPVPSTSPYAQFKVMELARGNVVVTLDGQGADELLAGYHYFFGFYFKELIRKGRLLKLGSESFWYFCLHQSLLGLKSLAFFFLPESLRVRAREVGKGYLCREFIDRNRDQSTLAEDLYGSLSLQSALLDHFEYKLEHLLKWEDRNSMHFSLEARVPFLDYRVVERTLALPSEKIINRGMTKSILREAMKGVLPEKIRMRRDKVGFDTPQDAWFRTPLFQKYILSIILSHEFTSRQIINPEKSKVLFKKHAKGDIGIAREIWKWINLELWYRFFID